ncbi:MAG: glutamine-hydrolyzing carbamoyl-phosphate synthase small subunit [Dissulfuribacterales bacterium]
MKAIIAFEDGRIFEGESFTGPCEVAGEMVFNTGMTGYQEILTDPSYKGQMVTMTYPLMGNYGINAEDDESSQIHVSAFVVREYQECYSNWRATGSLAEYLKSQGVPGIHQVDTRAITRHIRLAGAMKAVISTEDLNPDSLIKKAKESPGLVGRDLVREVTVERPYSWSNAPEPVDISCLTPKTERLRVAVLDCGLKFNQLRLLTQKGCECVVFPCFASADEMLSCNPDGIFLSNGPGDPAALTGIVRTVRNLIGKLPIFGICLGNQVLGQAVGGRTYKLKFGHRGANQPVKDLKTGKIEITSQNHGFAVDADSLPPDAEVTHVNLNDGTVEGFRLKSEPVFCVQYHPENAPGPHDSEYLFHRFICLMAETRR